jgi:hypothetical protein
LLERFLEVTGIIADRGLVQNTFQYIKNSLLFSHDPGDVPQEGWNENYQIKIIILFPPHKTFFPPDMFSKNRRVSSHRTKAGY